MKIGSIVKFFVGVVAVIQVQGVYGSLNHCNEIDGRVQCAAAGVFAHIESIDDYVARQHPSYCRDLGYFIKKGKKFEWSVILPENTKDSRICYDEGYSTHQGTQGPLSLTLVSEHEKTHLEKDDCDSLKEEIMTVHRRIDLEAQLVAVHARTAIQGQLPKESPYGLHETYRCNVEDCWWSGNLSWMNKMMDDGWTKEYSEEYKKELLGLPMTICPFIDSKKIENSTGLSHRISAIVFGQIPSTVSDICQLIRMKIKRFSLR